MRTWAAAFLGLAVLASLPLRSGAASEAPGYPRKALVVFRLAQLAPSAWDTAAAHDVIVSSLEPPEVVASVRSRRPQLLWFYRWMPQLAVDASEGEDFWHADTTWSLRRLVQYYALANDWYLRTTGGERISHWNHRLLNWTRFCPKGTYGTSKGLTYAEWLARVAMPGMMNGSGVWEPWGWGSQAYDGLWFEVMVDCMGSFGIEGIAEADPDGDGVAEGVGRLCTQGGSGDSLSILMAEVNEIFFRDFREAFQDRIPYVMNMNTPDLGPSWRETAWGVKVERWMDPKRPFQDWWDWFYGLRDGQGEKLWGPGYEYAERHYHASGPDDRTGWDLSFLQLYYDPSWPKVEHDRWLRFALGTTLLGDGYMVYTPDETRVTWAEPFGWDLGDPLGPYAAEPQEGGAVRRDTLYYRPFTKGFVLVNPQDSEVRGLAARDAYIDFWHTLTGLRVTGVRNDAATLAWFVPGDTAHSVDAFDLRSSETPIDLETWDSAEPVAGGPFRPAPGVSFEAPLRGLVKGRTYYAAARNVVRGRLDPHLSNVVSWVAETDTIPPAAVSDLESPRQGETWIEIAWTETGDDGTTGQAAAHEVRFLEGRAILSEEDWEGAERTAGIQPPGQPGTRQSLILQGLGPDRPYGIAVRLQDEAPNLGGISSPLLVPTLAPADTTRPGLIDDIHPLEVAHDTVLLGWTAPGDDGDAGRAEGYRLAYRAGPPLMSETDWEGSFQVEEGLPAPGDAGAAEGHLLEGLIPRTGYGIALRARDEAGNWSDLSPPLAVTTALGPPPDSLPPPRPGSVGLTWIEDARIALTWLPVSDPDLAGYYVYERRGSGPRTRVTKEPLLKPAWERDAPPGDAQYAYDVTALDAWGFESAPSDEARPFHGAFGIVGPLPNPTRRTASFRILLPPADGGWILLRAVLYSVGGRAVATLWNGPARAGRSLDLPWDGRGRDGGGAASGVYFLKVDGGGFTGRAKLFVVG